MVESLQTPLPPENEGGIDAEDRRDSFHFIVDYYGLTHRMCMTADHRALQITSVQYNAAVYSTM